MRIDLHNTIKEVLKARQNYLDSYDVVRGVTQRLVGEMTVALKELEELADKLGGIKPKSDGAQKWEREIRAALKELAKSGEDIELIRGTWRYHAIPKERRPSTGVTRSASRGNGSKPIV